MNMIKNDVNGIIITEVENACKRLSSFSAVGPLSLKPPPDYHSGHNDNDDNDNYDNDHDCKYQNYHKQCSLAIEHASMIMMIILD